jgi:hypothetical protein
MDKWTESDVKDVLCNPIYVGIGPYPKILSDEKWISCAEKGCKAMGHEAFFKCMIKMLRKSFGEV